jgi:hypothetical protein
MANEIDYKEKLQSIEDLVSVVKEMEELWNYHPDNPNKIDVIDLYKRYQEEKEFLKKIIGEF